ncbi:MAG: OPT family oligopeptide transporter [Deltaproteobacteria bacterium]|nr:MAG: OPT family oligopeptide transporter [Deltaproteobacteria bacterium]TMQ10862.1 MAG: OPT family oligopeptide transporter [Deltaproteobacteria bacterium]
MAAPGTTERAARDDAEAAWLRDVYRPDEPNLTVRGVIAGILIGFVMCLSNIYVFFKTGWSLGVTLTACILAFATFKLLQALGARPLGVLENNALTTVASGAGYMTGGGNAAAFGAIVMITTAQPSKVGLIAWFGLIAALGVFVAIPIKRQLINRESLAFPTGTATAETLRTIHAAGSGQGTAAAKALGIAAVLAGVLTFVRDYLKWVPGQWAPRFLLHGHDLVRWTISIKTELVLIGAGGLMSFRTGWSMLLGAIVNYAVIGPALLDHGLLKARGGQPVSYAGIIDWTLWPGAAILVGAGLTSFALDYKSIARSFTGLGALLGAKRHAEPIAGIAAVEAPDWWFPAGVLLLSPGIVALMYLMFDIPVWAALLAVPIAVLMGFVAARVTGETDVTPTKALGPVTQMIYGAITPGNLTGNIMSANVTGGIGLHAADLLTTLKTGWLLGARPRHQVYAQLFGVLAGAAVIVPLFYLVVPVAQLGTDEWPAPSALVWANVSKAFVNGIDALPRSAQIAIAIGLAFGIGLTLLDKAAPRARAFLPSPSAIGIAMVVPWSNSFAFFLGTAIAEVIRRRFRRYDPYTVPVASGLIAGESLVAIAITIATTVL